MPPTDPPASTAPPPRRTGTSVRLILWLLVFGVFAFGGWDLRAWWQANMGSSSIAFAPRDVATVADVPAAIDALRRDQRALAQRISDAASGNQLLRDEVLGVGERAALLEQSVARIAGPRAQGETALRLDEAELLLGIGQQQLELSADVGSALHAYTLADGTLAGSTDPAVLNLRQSLAQEIAALRSLPPDPRKTLAGRLDVFEAGLLAQPFAEPTPDKARASVFDRVLGSMVQVRRDEQRDLLAPAARDAALTAVRLELTIARLALERRDADTFRAALARVGGWLPRLFAPDVVARQLAQLATIESAPLKFELPNFGATLAELRRLRQEQPAAAVTSTPPAPAVPTPAPKRHP